MSMWITRNKRRILALVAAGAAGAGAAYYIYSRWLQDVDEHDDDRVRETVLRQTAVHSQSSQRLPAPPSGDAEQADARLSAHFDSISEIATRTTLPAFLPQLRIQLAANTRVAELLALLRQTRDGRQAAEAAPREHRRLSREEKVEAWSRLRVEAFTQAVSTCWALPLLDLLLRVQLYTVGRFLVLESIDDRPRSQRWQGREGRGLSAADAPGLVSTSCQQRYLQHADFFICAGVPRVVSQVRECVAGALAGVPLSRKCGVRDLLEILSSTQSALSAGLGGAPWRGSLLPERAEPHDDANETGRGAEAGGSLAEDLLLEDLLRDARSVLSSREFEQAARESVAHFTRTLADEVAAAAAARFPDEALAAGVAFAKLVPLPLAAADAVLESAVGLATGAAELRGVRSLCAHVYTSGPPL